MGLIVLVQLPCVGLGIAVGFCGGVGVTFLVCKISLPVPFEHQCLILFLTYHTILPFGEILYLLLATEEYIGYKLKNLILCFC